MIRTGKAFIIGGIVYGSRHTINGLIRRERIHPAVIAVTDGLGKTVRKQYTIGKRIYYSVY